MDESEVRNAIFTTLTHLAGRLERAATPAEVLEALVDGARGLVPFTACALALPHPWRVWRAAAHRPAEVVFTPTIPPEAEATLERFLAHGQPLHVDDLLAPPWSDATHRNILWKDGTRSAVLLPLQIHNRPIGTLSFTSLQPDRYPTLHRDTIRFLAWLIAATLYALPPEATP